VESQGRSSRTSREYYAYNTVAKCSPISGVTKSRRSTDNLHDDPWHHGLNMFRDRSELVRFDQRVKANKATIDGVSIADRAKSLELGKKIVDMRATNTVAASRRRLQIGGSLSHEGTKTRRMAAVYKRAVPYAERCESLPSKTWNRPYRGQIR